MNEILQQTRQALFDVFGKFIADDPEEAKRLIEKHTMLPEDDPGRWAPSSKVVIHAESIPLPPPCEVPVIERWCEVSARIGNGYHCEHINNAVAAVYGG